MNIKLALALLLLLSFSGSYAQQDPNDPGIQDSIILGSVSIDSGGMGVSIPMYAVTDDSIGYYSMGLHWSVPNGGVSLGWIEYPPPLVYWDIYFDTTLAGENSAGMWGMTGHSKLFTHGQRHVIMRLDFAVAHGADSQEIIIDTARVQGLGGLMLNGFIPAFVPGYIFVGPESGINDNQVTLPLNLHLSCYPNPFNSSVMLTVYNLKGGEVKLGIYDIQGRIVQSFDWGAQGGDEKIVWDARDASGKKVSSGIYFARVSTAQTQKTIKLLLVK